MILTVCDFAEEGPVAYVKGVQRQKIRKEFCVKHQQKWGQIGDDPVKTFFCGKKQWNWKEKNTSNQFEIKRK